MFTFQQYKWDSTKIKFANWESKRIKGCFFHVTYYHYLLQKPHRLGNLQLQTKQ